MPKTARWSGPSRADGATQAKPRLELPAGGAVDLAGKTSELVVAGSIQALGVDPAHRSVFGVSPIVPNPATPSGPTGAASIGEVQELIAAEPVLAGSGTLFVGGFGAAPGFGLVQVGNTTTETSLLLTPPTIPAMGVNGTARIVVAGDLLNSSGGAATLTFRFKIAGATVLTLAPSIPNDANTRPYRLVIDLHALGGAANISGEHVAHPGATAPLLHTVGISILATMGAAAEVWDLTAQWSVANANATMRRLLANLTYGIAA